MEPTTQKPKTTPKDFFLHLGAIVALYLSVWAIISLLFEIINYAFPRPFDYLAYSSGDISWQVAMLIIAFPTYLALMRMLYRGELAAPEKRELSVRKWLIYFTLFAAGLSILIDLVVLLNTFLQGEELTAGFLLKVFVVLVVAGAVFAYYINDVKYGSVKMFRKYFVWGTAAFIFLSIIAGFSIVGSPMTQRIKRFDQTRVNDLQSIQYQVVNYWQHKQTFPATIGELNDPIGGFVLPTDPETNSSYEYTTNGTMSFQLCATFGRPSGNDQPTIPRIAPTPMYPGGKGGIDEHWQHGAGRTCFERTIDPKFYPPIK
ncbi:MAG: DUF5671 domain-containing protein [Minisyncoccota bacterium]